MTNSQFPNPLLERIPNYTLLSEIVAAMTIDPMQGINVAELSVIERSDFLTGEKVILQPIKKTIMAMMTWYGMLRRGLENRNPVIAENRKKYWDALTEGSLPHNNSRSITGISVNVLKGPTGTGKTITASAFVSLFPQVVEHGRNDVAGWQYLQQLVYLQLNMSHDGSRYGLIKGILEQMDEVLGTTYAIVLPRVNKTIETLSVATINTLRAHYTGILFIDENQLRNLVTGPQAEKMQLFILQLMNSGIPIVVSGNERAFDWVTYSQDLTRLTLTPKLHFHPIGALDEDDWQTDWESLCDLGVMKLYVLDEPPSDPAACSKTLFECSGGIARLAISLWTMAQVECLLSDKHSISPDDILSIYNGYSYVDVRMLADGFRYKSLALLRNFPDIDCDFYERAWNPEKFLNADLGGQLKPKSKSVPALKTPKGKSEIAKYRSAVTREKNKSKKVAHLQSTLPAEDMRMQGAVNHHLEQMIALQNSVEIE